MILLAVIISNAISALIEPSFFTNIIHIKKLPFLPDIVSSSSAAYNIFVEDFMNFDVKYIYYGMTYNELKDTLKDDKSLKVFPLVDSTEQMVLLGSIQKRELVGAIEEQIGMDRRLAIKAARRREEEVERKRKLREKIMEDHEQKIKVLEAELEQAKLEKSVKSDENLDLLTAPIGERRESRFEVSSVTSPTSSRRSAIRPGILKHSNADINATIHHLPSNNSISSITSAADRWRYVSTMYYLVMLNLDCCHM